MIFYILLFGTFFFEVFYCDAQFASDSFPQKFHIENHHSLNKPKRHEKDLSNQNNLKRYKTKERNGGSRFKDKRASSGGKKKPVYFSYNFQKLPLPTNNIGVIETLSDSESKNKKEELIENTFSKTVTDNSQKSSENSAMGDYDEIIEELKQMLKDTENIKENFLRRRRNQENKVVKKKKKKYNNYIDYSNSQMPFNEGQPVKRKLESNNQKRNKRTGTCQRKDRETNRECKKRMTSSLHKGFENLLRSKGENSEILSDGAEYLRVRRFLDQARRKRYKSVTLETKEAAMSRVLDPNLNVDGILEPHVRKRREFT